MLSARQEEHGKTMKQEFTGMISPSFTEELELSLVFVEEENILVWWNCTTKADPLVVEHQRAQALCAMNVKQEGLAFALTAMYGLHPASLVLAMESTSCPLMPKSQSLIFPLLSRRILEGLISARHRCHSTFK